MCFLVLLQTGRIPLFNVRKYEKTIDVKTTIESVLALFVAEKMSRSSVKGQAPSFVFHETKLGLEIQKLLYVFLSHFYQMLISVS